MGFFMTAQHTHTHTHTQRTHKKKRSHCRVCALGITAFLICLLLPAQAAAQTNIMVTATPTAIVQGESAEITLAIGGGGLFQFTAQLTPTTPPVTLSVSNQRAASDLLASVGATGSVVVTVETYKNYAVESIRMRNSNQPAAMEISEDTPFNVVLSSVQNITFNGENILTLPFTIKHVPGIRLRIRVYLEGALR